MQLHEAAERPVVVLVVERQAGLPLHLAHSFAHAPGVVMLHYLGVGVVLEAHHDLAVAVVVPAVERARRLP